MGLIKKLIKAFLDRLLNLMGLMAEIQREDDEQLENFIEQKGYDPRTFTGMSHRWKD